MPDAAANPCPDLPALPPAADLETRAVLRYCLAVHAALAELRLTTQPISTSAMVATMTRLEAQNAVRQRGFRKMSSTSSGEKCLGAPAGTWAAVAASTGDLVARGPGERHHASCVPKEAVGLGILREEGCWRAKIFVNRSYLDVLASDQPAFGPDLRRVARVASRRQAKAQAA